MEREELRKLYTKLAVPARYYNPSEDWKKLFDFYHSYPDNPKLGLWCQPCYRKVLAFVASYLGIPVPDFVSLYQPRRTLVESKRSFGKNHSLKNKF